MAKRKVLDWEWIEKEWFSRQLSICEIARQAGCSETAIRKKAKRLNWQQNLAGKVRERVREKLVRTEVRVSNATDEEIIEHAAERGVLAVQLMRSDIAKLRAIEQSLLEELSDSPTKLFITQYQGDIIEKTIGMTVSERSAAAANLAQVQHKRIALERQALNLDDKNSGDDGNITLKIIYDKPKQGIPDD